MGNSAVSNIFHSIKEFVCGKKQEQVVPVKALGDKGLKLTHYLSPETIVVRKGETGKEDAIRPLVEKLCKSYNIDNPVKVFEKVMEREKLESTFLDNEVAIPHARYEGVKEIKAVLGVFPSGVKEDDTGKLPVQFMFLFLSPIDAFTQHLQLLTRIAFIFEDARLKGKLLSSDSPVHIYKLLTEKEGVS